MVAFMRLLDFRTYAASMMATHDCQATVKTTKTSTSVFWIAPTTRTTVRPASQQPTANAIRTRGV